MINQPKHSPADQELYNVDPGNEIVIGSTSENGLQRFRKIASAMLIDQHLDVSMFSLGSMSASGMKMNFTTRNPYSGLDAADTVNSALRNAELHASTTPIPQPQVILEPNKVDE